MDSESWFIDYDRYKIFSYLVHSFWPDRVREGVRMPTGLLFWMKCIAEQNFFVSKKLKIMRSIPAIPMPM